MKNTGIKMIQTSTTKYIRDCVRYGRDGTRREVKEDSGKIVLVIVGVKMIVTQVLLHSKRAYWKL